jgi:hypothetical protein
MIFGKMFGYLAIIQCKSFYQSSYEELMLDIFSRIFDMYSKKVWMQELILETIFLMLHRIYDSQVLSSTSLCNMIKKLKSIIPMSISDVSPSQLLLMLQLEHLLSLISR